MRKAIVIIFIVLALLAGGGALWYFVFRGDDSGENTPPVDPDTTYKIEYNDGDTTRTIEVKDGDSYSIEKIPTKRGYDFLGLFNAEVGGVKFVDENGKCTMPFGSGKDIVLHAQYEAHTYSVLFDYGEAGNSDYTATVKYDELILLPSAPNFIAGKEFVGWFTGKDCGGVKIANPTEVITEVGTVNYDNFRLDSLSDGCIKLYAGFNDLYYKVSQYFGDELLAEGEYVYGTPLEEILVTKLSDGRVIGDWMKPNGSYLTEDYVTGELVLKANKIGYTITFDVSGGDSIKSIIGYGGTYADLPIPEKEHNMFLGWEYDGENIGTHFLMPDKHITVKAVWKQSEYQVFYNSEGGSSVDTQWVEVGRQVPLDASPERKYHMFAGWAYDGELIEDTLKMPEEDITLTATWDRTHYCVTIQSSLDNRVLAETWVELGEAYVFDTTLAVTGYSNGGYVDKAGNPYSGTLVFDEDKVFTLRLNPKTFEVTYNSQGGSVSPAKTTVTYNSAYTLAVPTKPGYAFMGWFTAISGGTQVTHKNGASVSAWTYGENRNVYAHWAALTGKYTNGNRYTITDKDSVQGYDTVNLAMIFGETVSTYISLGYTKLTLSILLNISEKDDGYQEMYISKSNSSFSGSLWSKTNIEHGSGKKDTSAWAHSFTVTLDLSNLNNVIYFLYGAHGSGADTWYRNSVSVDMTIS